MNRLICILLVSIAFSCSREAIVCKHESSSNNETYSDLSILDTLKLNQWFSFDHVLNDEDWKNSEDIDSRVAQCQIPKEQLARIPTNILIGLCADYPFGVFYLANNDITQGIKTIMNEFNGFSELTRRFDCAKLLLDYYRAVDISRIAQKITDEKTSYQDLLKIGYIEMFISQMIDLFSNEELNELNILINQKHAQMALHRNVFGPLSINSGNYLQNAIRAKDKQITELERAASLAANENVYLYTPYGKRVSVFLRPEELAPKEITSLKEAVLSTFNNVEVLDSATTTYNCHSYAWNLSRGGTLCCWMNGSNNPVHWGSVDSNGNSYHDNIEKYWTNDGFIETSSSNAPFIYYYKGDHSARQSTSVPGMYESKWGVYPLVRHAPRNCPSTYKPSHRKYYDYHRYSHLLNCSAGIGCIEIGQECRYSPVPDLPSGITSGYWTVTNAKGDDVIGTYASISSFSNIYPYYANISFSRQGIYCIELHFQHFYVGEIIHSWEALVEP